MRIDYYELKPPNTWKYIGVFLDVYVRWDTFRDHWILYNNDETRHYLSIINEVKPYVEYTKRHHHAICKTEHGEFNLKKFENLVLYFDGDEQLMNFKLRV